MKKSINEAKTEQKAGTVGRTPKKLHETNYTFNSLEETRLNLADLTKAFLDQEITERHYRAAVYGVNSIVKLLIHEKISALEDRIKGLERGRKV
ncbi:MAG: hypothetical protein A2001_11105 [Treponema sp. GWC1_61_84]|nr:MAG: hypothetical protein A2001_11105 [Treponema sp. GWC1_61_84]